MSFGKENFTAFHNTDIGILISIILRDMGILLDYVE